MKGRGRTDGTNGTECYRAGQKGTEREQNGTNRDRTRAKTGDYGTGVSAADSNHVVRRPYALGDRLVGHFAANQPAHQVDPPGSVGREQIDAMYGPQAGIEPAAAVKSRAIAAVAEGMRYVGDEADRLLAAVDR